MKLTCGLLVVVAALACVKGPDAGRKGPKETANLPARPDLAARPLAERYQDGTLTVEGFSRHARENTGQDATVKGYVKSVEQCPPTRPKCATVPHLVLVDDIAKARRQLLVVSEPREAVLEGFAQGSLQTFTGKVAFWSPDGRLINLDGILVWTKPEPPSPAPDAKPGEPAPAR
jgi:hypothetical protein